TSVADEKVLGSMEVPEIVVTRPAEGTGKKFGLRTRTQVMRRVGQLLPAAELILPQLRGRHDLYSSHHLARLMAQRREFLNAHPPASPNDVLAFGYLRRDRSPIPLVLVSRRFVFEGLGYTAALGASPEDRSRESHTRAAGALVAFAVTETPP